MDGIPGTHRSKWTFIATVAALNCVMRGTVGEFVAVPHGREIALAILAKSVETADACGFAVPEADISTTANAVTQEHSPLTASMYRDLVAGRLTESEPAPLPIL